MRELNLKEMNHVAGGLYDYFFPVLGPNEVMTGYGIEVTYETVQTGWFTWREVAHINHKEVVEQRPTYVVG